ncbi:MAG TPA: leucyl aminopeptidase [Burkholderiales bacterium]|nr:leucyl aminopeptidase [Burkholderiales bacterium]
MEFSIKSGSPDKQRSACVVAGIYEPRKLSAAAAVLDKASKGQLTEILRRGDMDGRRGSTLLLHSVDGLPCDRVLLVGLGREREFREKEFLEAVQTAVRALSDTGAVDAVLCLTELPLRKHDPAWRVYQAVIAATAASYRFDRLKSKAEEQRRALRRLTLWVPSRGDLPAAEEALRQGLATAQGINLAKDLGNLPSNICTPGYLAEQALGMAKAYDLKSEILGQKDMERLKMGALLAVTRGSREPARLISLEYHGAGRNARPVVLVGKGITFDTGGISLKPAAEMDEMKFDMCGAASVLGTVKAAAQMQLPINLVGVIPTCENMPGGNATKPGDVVTSMSGQTIEILNTDAEGRLILCDALTYAERFNPEVVVDIATLTGACVIALGHVASGLFANDDALARELLAAGDLACDRAWQLPLWDDYQEQLKSNFADMANIGGRPAGSVTAACYLSRFAKKYRWAHLDIAGVAWKSGKEKGATGRPVPLLTQFLIRRAAAAAR